MYHSSRYIVHMKVYINSPCRILGGELMYIKISIVENKLKVKQNCFKEDGMGREVCVITPKAIYK